MLNTVYFIISGDNNRHVPDILQSRSPPTNRSSTPHSDPHSNRMAPPSYGSFLRQKSLRENTGRSLHSPAYSVDSTTHGSYSIDSHRHPMEFSHPGHHSPDAPVVPSRSYKNSGSHSQNISKTEPQRNRPSSTGPVFSTVHSTSALANHCRNKNSNAKQSAKHCQADSFAIKQETGSSSKSNSQNKRVNFSTPPPEEGVRSSSNVAIGKYSLKDVPPNGFTSVMV